MVQPARGDFSRAVALDAPSIVLFAFAGATCGLRLAYVLVSNDSGTPIKARMEGISTPVYGMAKYTTSQISEYRMAFHFSDRDLDDGAIHSDDQTSRKLISQITNG